MLQVGLPNRSLAHLRMRFGTNVNVTETVFQTTSPLLGVLTKALARRLSIQMHFLHTKMRSRFTLADPNAFPVLSNVIKGVQMKPY